MVRSIPRNEGEEDEELYFVIQLHYSWKEASILGLCECTALPHWAGSHSSRQAPPPSVAHAVSCSCSGAGSPSASTVIGPSVARPPSSAPASTEQHPNGDDNSDESALQADIARISYRIRASLPSVRESLPQINKAIVLQNYQPQWRFVENSTLTATL